MVRPSSLFVVTKYVVVLVVVGSPRMLLCRGCVRKKWAPHHGEADVDVVETGKFRSSLATTKAAAAASSTTAPSQSTSGAAATTSSVPPTTLYCSQHYDLSSCSIYRRQNKSDWPLKRDWPLIFRVEQKSGLQRYVSSSRLGSCSNSQEAQNCMHSMCD
jgi:hypothetical protein